MAKLSPPPLRTPFLDGNMVSRPWARFFEDLVSRQADTQSDAATVSQPPTGPEVNAIVAVINALIDKLQAAGLME